MFKRPTGKQLQPAIAPPSLATMHAAEDEADSAVHRESPARAPTVGTVHSVYQAAGAEVEPGKTFGGRRKNDWHEVLVYTIPRVNPFIHWYSNVFVSGVLNVLNMRSGKIPTKA